jgi:hypothetical protein
MQGTTRHGLLLDRVAALSGIVAVGLLLAYISVAAPDAEWEDPSGVIATSLADHRDTAKIAGYLGLAAAFALLWFIGYLHGHLRRAEGDSGWLASVALAGGITTVALHLVDVSFTLAESVLSSYDTDTQVAKTYLIYHSESGSLLVPGLGALVAASTLAGFRYGTLPRWLTWFGVAIMLLMVPAATLTSGVGAVLGSLWIIAASVALFLRIGRAVPPTSVATPLTPSTDPLQ